MPRCLWGINVNLRGSRCSLLISMHSLEAKNRDSLPSIHFCSEATFSPLVGSFPAANEGAVLEKLAACDSSGDGTNAD